jgi:hypothetical protein
MPLPIRLKECKGLGGVVLVARSQVAASFSTWQMTRLPDVAEQPVHYEFLGRGTIDAYWSTEQPDVLRLDCPLGGTWTWAGLIFEFGDGSVRSTLIGPPEEER